VKVVYVKTYNSRPTYKYRPRSSDNAATLIGVAWLIVVLVVAVLGTRFYWSERSSCNAKGGVLVKSQDFLHPYGCVSAP
jgi:hypothetical protein